MANNPQEAAVRLLECVSDGLSSIGNPVCKRYQTIGVPVIAQCCECDDGLGGNGELSIHFRRLFDADASSLIEVQRVRPCKGGSVAAQYRMVLARCYPTIDEQGYPPDPEDLIEAADEQFLDVQTFWQSLVCCSEMDLRVDDISADLSPQGGCSFVFADITVAVTIPQLPSG